jgi:hypothetical protein
MTKALKITLMVIGAFVVATAINVVVILIGATLPG